MSRTPKIIKFEQNELIFGILGIFLMFCYITVTNALLSVVMVSVAMLYAECCYVIPLC
jgi:hypothetical protein